MRFSQNGFVTCCCQSRHGSKLASGVIRKLICYVNAEIRRSQSLQLRN
jgi:hypothetical protein